MKKRLRIPEGVKTLTKDDYNRYAKLDSGAVEKYPETLKYLVEIDGLQKGTCITAVYDGVIKVELNGIIEFVTIEKAKPHKYYLTSNIFYGGVHFRVRMKVVEICKKMLDDKIAKEYFKDLKTPIEIEFIYSSPKQTFDIDNKLYFWNKIFADWMRENGFIKDDNVKFINKITYRYEKGNLNLKIIVKNAN
jgi:hypothetical protein